MGAKMPVITVFGIGEGNEVIIYGQDGLEAARIVYRPDNPIHNGVKVWIETENNIDIK